MVNTVPENLKKRIGLYAILRKKGDRCFRLKNDGGGRRTEGRGEGKKSDSEAWLQKVGGGLKRGEKKKGSVYRGKNRRCGGVKKIERGREPDIDTIRRVIIKERKYQLNWQG